MVDNPFEYGHGCMSINAVKLLYAFPPNKELLAASLQAPAVFCGS
jgi:hypothetical protein